MYSYVILKPACGMSILADSILQKQLTFKESAKITTVVGLSLLGHWIDVVFRVSALITDCTAYYEHLHTVG